MVPGDISWSSHHEPPRDLLVSHHGAPGDISWQDMECKDWGGGRVLAKKFSHWLGLFDLTVTNNILTNPHMVKALLVV